MSLFSLLNLSSAMPKVKAMGRYNFSKRQMIPTFGNVPKPGATTPKPAVKVPAIEVVTKTAVEQQPTVSQPAAITHKPGLVRSGWLGRNNPFVKSTPAVAKPPGPAQAELSLDKVKVVRNDLSDADIEVVQKDLDASKLPSEALVRAKRYAATEDKSDKSGRKAWRLLGSRVFGAAAAKQ